MLCLQRKKNQTVKIGESTVTIVAVKGSRVTLGIDAPASVRVVRDDANRKERAA